MDTGAKRIFTEQDGDQVVEVWEDGRLRWLTFGNSVVQSTIDLEDAGRLPSPSCQALFSALLFIPEPDRVLLLGTGGGSIARYLAKRRPVIKGDAVERSALVAEVARQFFQFPTPERGWRLLEQDARDYVRQSDHAFDLVVLDIAEQTDPPAWVTDPEFLAGCRSCLTERGALAVNLIPKTADAFKQALWNIRQTFERRTVCLSVPDHRNIAVLAFPAPPRYHKLADLEQRAAALSRQWGIKFGPMLAQMRRDNPVGSGVF